MERLVGVGASPGIAIGVAHVLASRVDDPRAAHRRRAGRGRDQPLRAGAGRNRRPAGPHPGADRRTRRGRAPVPHPRGAPPHAVRRAPGRAGPPHHPRRADRRPSGRCARRSTRSRRCSSASRTRTSATGKSDVALVGERLLRNLVGLGDSASPEDAPKGSIAVAHELSPADAAQLGRAEAARLLHRRGREDVAHRHRGARARAAATSSASRGSAHRVWSGMTLVIDGFRGEVILDPDAEALRRYEARADVHRARAQRLAAIRDVPSSDQRRDARSTWPPTSRCWRRSRSPSSSAPRRSASSAPSSSTSSAPSCRPRTSSTRTRWPRSRAWAGGRSPSARSTSAATSCRRRCASRAAPTRPWGCGRSATRCAATTSSGPSCARSIARRGRDRCRSCSR